MPEDRVEPRAHSAGTVLPCKHCGQPLHVRHEDVGKRRSCSRCGHVFRVGRRPAPAVGLDDRAGHAARAATETPWVEGAPGRAGAAQLPRDVLDVQATPAAVDASAVEAAPQAEDHAVEQAALARALAEVEAARRAKEEAGQRLAEERARAQAEAAARAAAESERRSAEERARAAVEAASAARREASRAAAEARRRADLEAEARAKAEAEQQAAADVARAETWAAARARAEAERKALEARAQAELRAAIYALRQAEQQAADERLRAEAERAARAQAEAEQKAVEERLRSDIATATQALNEAEERAADARARALVDAELRVKAEAEHRAAEARLQAEVDAAVRARLEAERAAQEARALAERAAAERSLAERALAERALAERARGEEPASPSVAKPPKQAASEFRVVRGGKSVPPEPPARTPLPARPDATAVSLREDAELAASQERAGGQSAMYAAFYGFTAAPFGVTPDPRFFFPSSQHNEALATLIYAVTERKGFALLTGEIGCGKTTVARALLRDLGPETPVALILNSHLNSRQLLQAICQEFELPIEGRDRFALHNQINEYLLQQLAADRNVVLLIDEAQNLSGRTLETLRMISNLETETEKLVQIILMGQPGLQRLIDSPELRQLRQRIAARFHLTGLTAQETIDYIAHRMRVAGNERGARFAEDSLQEIVRASGGVPRLINIICDHALVTGFVRQTKRITGDMAREVIRDMAGGLPPERPGQPEGPITRAVRAARDILRRPFGADTGA